ncbi:MAG: hypothetical protein CMB64_04820 [Euryarchaeota archaeon]|nr:hypothetical protein [Euryarchaeota archaeon]
MDVASVVCFLKTRDVFSYYCSSSTVKDDLSKYVSAYKISTWWYSIKTKIWMERVRRFVLKKNIMSHRTIIHPPLNYEMLQLNKKSDGFGFPYCVTCFDEWGDHWKSIANFATYEVEGFKMRYAMPSLRFHCYYCFKSYEDNFEYEWLRKPIFTSYKSSVWNVLHFANESDSDEVHDEY